MRSGAGNDVAVLGAGSWGTALAVLLADNGHRVRLWARDDRTASSLRANSENRRYLPGIGLPEGIVSLSDLEQSVGGASTVVFAVPSGALRAVAAACVPALDPEALLVSAAKGLEEGTGMRMTEVLDALIPGAALRTAALSGPNLAVEVARRVPTASVAAAIDDAAARSAQTLFLGPVAEYFRVYTSRDVVGVELGGAVKNVIAIAAGVSDGLGFGDNSKAALMTRGLAEAMRLGVAQGAQPGTFLGLSGVGDLMATGASRLSRNYRVGFGLGQGRALPEILAAVGQVAEGVPTTHVLCDLAVSIGVAMPVCSALRTVLAGERTPPDVMRELMLRPPREETDVCMN